MSSHFVLRSSLSFVSCALLVVACGSDSNSGTASGTGGSIAATGGTTAGTGGATVSTGGSATGGASGSGGATVATGGATTTGGATNSGGAAGAGAAGSGGAGGSSEDGGAEPDSGTPTASGCRTNADCAAVPGKPLCDAKNDKCVACHTNAQCSLKEECVQSACVPLVTCKSSLDCASGADGKTICDKTNSACVQCTTSSDCGDGKVCTNRVCHKSCTSDNECTSLHQLCNMGLTFNSQCTDCTASSDCGAGKYCEAGQCVPFTCTPAQQSCVQNNVALCNDTGSDVIPQMQCTLNLLSPVCLLDGDNAKCVGTCEDQKRDGFETDVDCGGSLCTRCQKGKACSANGDCSSNKCTSSKCE